MPAPLDPNAWRRTVTARLLIVTLVFGAWAAIIEGRLVYLQVYDHQHLKAEAEEQQSSHVTMTARRGNIVDRQGRLLAYSVDADSVYAVPSRIPSIPATLDKLCAALDCSVSEKELLRKRFGRQKSFAYVRRWVTPHQASTVMALDLPGVGLLKEPRRFYPNRELAAHVLGYVGIDRDKEGHEREKGLGGLELLYDNIVRGRDAALLVQADNKGRAFSRVGPQPVPGASLELTIDLYLQHIAERELKAGVEENRAAGGSVVVMDPNNGEILAMASYPTFNPNQYRLADGNHRRNRAVQDSYEPGSTFKMITAVAALEEGVVTPDTMIDTGDGTFQMPGRTVRDTHGHGTIPFSDVIALSSNIGSIKVGWKVGAERFVKYLARFGFGRTLSPDFKGSENGGIVWPLDTWTQYGALASVSMGYQINVTPLQMAAAASAIANGGEVIKPRVLRAVIEGGHRRLVPRDVVGRVASPGTIATLTTILEAVVDRGTAKTTQIAGFTSAGKTGTSKKVDPRTKHYTAEYNASFVGFVPSRKPALTILVWIDTPTAGKTYGGSVAGPVYQRIASEALQYLGVPSGDAPPATVLVKNRAETGMKVSGPIRPLTILPPAPGTGELALPDVRGLGAREALRVLARLGLTARVGGDGLVLEQDPPPGTVVEPGATCRLLLGRAPREASAGGENP